MKKRISQHRIEETMKKKSMYYNEQEERMAHEESDSAQAQAEAEMQEYNRPMPIERQVSSLDLSKALRALGVAQESLFYWGNTIGQVDDSCWRIQPKDKDTGMVWVSAFTVAELGEIMKGKRMGVSAFSSIQEQWWIRGGIETNGHYEHLEVSETEADVRAKMLIYLLKSKLLTL